MGRRPLVKNHNALASRSWKPINSSSPLPHILATMVSVKTLLNQLRSRMETIANTALALSTPSTPMSPSASASDSGLTTDGAQQRSLLSSHKTAQLSLSSRTMLTISTVSTENCTTEWQLSSATSTPLQPNPLEASSKTSAAFTHPSCQTSSGKSTTPGIVEQLSLIQQS